MSSQASDASAARPVSVADLQAAKARGERFAMLTAYDYPTARTLDEAGVPVLLVGDSLSDNVLGHDSTVPVTVDDMLHHTKAVVRGTRRALVVADLPFGSYQVSVEDGLRASIRLMKEGGANAVKAEGGGTVVELAHRLVRSGVPFMGHLGLTPQSVNLLGYRVQGRDADAADAILEDARALEKAGAFAVVLECVPAELAGRVTDALALPTIGIGAGPRTDAQVLVFHDLVGLSEGRKPRFVKQYADTRAVIADAVKAFSAEVAAGDYPGPEHAYE